MITTARRVRALGVLAMFVGACTSQVPTGTTISAPAAGPAAAPQAAPFQRQAVAPTSPQPAAAEPAADTDVRDQAKGRKPAPNPRAPKGGGDKLPDYGRKRPSPPQKPSKPRPTPRPTPDNRYTPPDSRYRDPDYRYRDPDYRYYPPNDRYADVKITRTWVDQVGPNAVTVHWTTNMPSNGRVEWRDGDDRQYSDWQYPADSYHSYTIKGLQPGTAYWYKVTVRATGGVAVSSPEATFTTSTGTEAPGSDAGQ